MRASALQTLLAFGSLASASLPSAFRAFKPAAGVHPRQAFDPETETRVASDCTDFGPNYVMCVPGTGTFVDPPLCIDPTIGETCCDRKCTLAPFSAELASVETGINTNQVPKKGGALPVPSA